MDKIKKIRVGIIGTNGLPGKYGGWDQLVNHLTLNLRNRFNFLVYTSYYNAEPGLMEYNGAKLKIVRLKANGIQSIVYDMVSIFHACFNCDVLFICGTSGCIFLPFFRLFGKTIILNPDGLEWKRKKWSKPVKWFLKLSENFGIRFSHYVISDNRRISEYIKDTYKIEARLIEYGGDQVLKIPLSPENEYKYGIKSGEYAFKVCRIEPENNIHTILEAFKGSALKLVIVGNWNYSSYGQDLKSQYSSYSNMKLLDPIYEQGALDQLRSNCGLYVHGHTVGGTNPSLVEAMNLKLFIIAYDVDFNIETTEGSALYFKSVDELRSLVAAFEKDEINVQTYKEAMVSIAKRRYTWELITEKYSDVFIESQTKVK